MAEFRTERDSMGEMQVPADAYYGAQTARAVENFPISKSRFGRPFIRAQLPRGGDFRLRESQSLVQFLCELRHDIFEQADSPFINHYGNKIPHWARNPCMLHNRIKHCAFLSCWDGRILPNLPQFPALAHQFCNLLRFRQSLRGIETARHNHICECPSVSVDDRCHN